MAGLPAQIFWDRVTILYNGVIYLPNGQIRNFTMTANYNAKIQPSMTPNGISLGHTIGNKSITINWTELLPSQAEYLNFRTFCLANPDGKFTIVPISIADARTSVAPSFTVIGIQPTGATIDFSGEGEAGVRPLSFSALDSSNL